MSEKTGTVKVTETLKVIMNGADEEKWREFTDPEEAGRWLMDEATGYRIGDQAVPLSVSLSKVYP